MCGFFDKSRREDNNMEQLCNLCDCPFFPFIHFQMEEDFNYHSNENEFTE